MPDELNSAIATADAVATSSRLLLLDDAWTAYVTNRDPGPDGDDLATLETLVDEMVRGLDYIAGVATTAAARLRDLSDETVLEAAQNLVRRNPQSWERVGLDLGSEFEEFGVRQSLLIGCAYVGEFAGDEIRDLREKLQRLQNGEAAEGDMGARIRCALELAGLGFAVLGCTVGLIACLSAAGPAVIALILTWENSGCRKLIAALREHLQTHGVQVA